MFKIFNRKDKILEGLYHDYSFFGYIGSTVLPGHYKKNQEAKAPIITAYIAFAIAKSKEEKSNLSFAELFCADAYYAMVASRLGAQSVVGIDNLKDQYADAKKLYSIASRLKVDNFTFIEKDVNKLDTKHKYDIVANVGGLYHVSNPEEILEKSYKLTNYYLIVQSVVSLGNEDPNYFETPAPGWDWGCRYNRISFDKMIRSKGYNIIDSHFNELQGNNRLEDRGSVYYLIKK